MINDINPVKLRRWVATSFPWGDLAKIYKEEDEPRFKMIDIRSAMNKTKGLVLSVDNAISQCDPKIKPEKYIYNLLESLSTEVYTIRTMLQKTERVNKTDADAFRAIIDNWVLWLMERLLKAHHPKYKQLAHNMLLYLRGQNWELAVHNNIFMQYQDDFLSIDVLFGYVCDYIIPKMNQYMRSVENAQGKVVIYE